MLAGEWAVKALSFGDQLPFPRGLKPIPVKLSPQEGPQGMSDQEEFPPMAYSLQGAALAVGRSHSRIRKAIHDKELTARKDGKSILIEAAELQRWLSNLPVLTDENRSKTSQNPGRFA